jgi:hypothetical protein
MDESFFPVLWSREEDRRTAWIEGYCETGRRRPQSQRTLAA